ncbi:hypothetical protein D3C72_2120910 [compost metagenome]
MKQLFVVGIHGSVLISEFRLGLFSPFRYNIAKSDHDSAFYFLQSRHMFAVCDTAAANNPYF